MSKHFTARGNRGKEIPHLTDKEKAQITYAVEKMHEQLDKYQKS